MGAWQYDQTDIAAWLSQNGLTESWFFHTLGQPECKLRNPGFPIFQSSQQEGFS